MNSMHETLMLRCCTDFCTFRICCMLHAHVHACAYMYIHVCTSLTCRKCLILSPSPLSFSLSRNPSFLTKSPICSVFHRSKLGLTPAVVIPPP